MTVLSFSNHAHAPDKVMRFARNFLSAIDNVDEDELKRLVHPDAVAIIHPTPYTREAWIHYYIQMHKMMNTRTNVHFSTESIWQSDGAYMLGLLADSRGAAATDRRISTISLNIIGQGDGFQLVGFHLASTVPGDITPIREARRPGYRYIEGTVATLSPSNGGIINMHVQDNRGIYWVRLTQSQQDAHKIKVGQSVSIEGETVWVPQKRGGHLEATAPTRIQVLGNREK